MPVLSCNYVISKAFLISGSFVMGSGAIYLVYQMYTFSKQLNRLNCQMTILTEKLLRAEADILQLRRDGEPASGSEDADDEFVDAEETDQDMVAMNGYLPTLPNTHTKDRTLEEEFENVDHKTGEGGFENLIYTLKHLKKLLKSHTNESEILWRIARTCYILSREDMLPAEGPEEKHKQLMSEATGAAQNAVNFNPKSGNAHKWMAIVLGSQTQDMPVQEQIKSAFIIKDHIETAIYYRPDDALLHHMMGRWCYSVYMLSWVERKLASALFATPPTATLEDAMGYFEKAENLDPLSSISNELYLGKSFIAKSDYKTAVKYLRAGKKLKCSTADDKTALQEIQKLLEQYQSYAS